MTPIDSPVSVGLCFMVTKKPVQLGMFLDSIKVVFSPFLPEQIHLLKLFFLQLINYTCHDTYFYKYSTKVSKTKGFSAFLPSRSKPDHHF